MGQRLAAGILAIGLAIAVSGCGGPPKPASTVKMDANGKTGVDQKTGLEVHTGRPNVNPNAQMPGVGSSRR